MPIDRELSFDSPDTSNQKGHRLFTNKTQVFPDDWSPQDDLDELSATFSTLWNDLGGSAIFLTGGTGTIGRWLLEAICHANQKLGLDISVSVLSRYPDKVSGLISDLRGDRYITFLPGDVTNFDWPKRQFTHVIHGATSSSTKLNQDDPIEMFNTIVRGTQNVLEMSKHAGVSRFLLLSSGAVYGPQPDEVSLVDEGQPTAPNTTDSSYVYGEAKRAAEMLCSIYTNKFEIQTVLARIFAVVGPGMPLDQHFAIGNLIGDSLSGRNIEILGTGKPIRSYLYLADVAYWLLKMLVDGKSGSAYNVGSEREISLRDLADLVSKTLGGSGVTVRGQGEKGPNPGRYVPSTAKAREELGLRESFTLQEAILRTATWYRSTHG